MGFFARLANGLRLGVYSVRTVREHPPLLAFPVLSALAGLLFLLLAVTGFFFLVGVAPGAVADLAESGPLYWVALAVSLFVTSTLTTFFNAALVHESVRAFRGEAPAVRSGLRGAWRVRRKLVLWGLVSAVVGLVLNLLDSTDTPLGDVARLLLGVAWSVLTFFVVPVMVFEDLGVRGSLRESARVFRETWGENVGVNVGITALFALGLFAILALTILGAVLVGGLGGVLVLLVGGLLMALALVAWATSAGVARAALYVYAVAGREPEGFEGVDFDGIAVERRRSGGIRRGI